MRSGRKPKCGNKGKKNCFGKFGPHRPAPRSHCSTEITVTDLGSTFSVSFLFRTLAEIGFGATVVGASNVLTLSTLGAVSVSPAADLAAIPAKLISISAA